MRPRAAAAPANVPDAQWEEARALSIAHPVPPTTFNLSNLELFPSLKAGYRTLFIGDAVKAPDGHWVVPMGRRIETPSGAFAGAAAARGRIEYFEQFYRNVQLDHRPRSA